MKRGKINVVISTLIAIQSISFIFIPARFILCGTIAFTCLLYWDIKRIIQTMLGVLAYCSVIFSIFYLNSRTSSLSEFLGIESDKIGMKNDMFFHPGNTLYFALLANENSSPKLIAFNQTYQRSECQMQSENMLSNILNLDKSKAYENLCIFNKNRALVHVNNTMMPYRESERNFFKHSVEELMKKQEILKDLNINIENAILFSIYIPEYDDFWTEYLKFRDSNDMLKYIIENIGLIENLELADFKYVIFCNGDRKKARFAQVNDFQITIIE